MKDQLSSAVRHALAGCYQQYLAMLTWFWVVICRKRMFVYVYEVEGSDYISEDWGGGQIITIDYRGCPRPVPNSIFLWLDLPNYISAAKS